MAVGPFTEYEQVRKPYPTVHIYRVLAVHMAKHLRIVTFLVNSTWRDYY